MNADEFYIGWSGKAPRGIGRCVRWVVCVAMPALIALAALAAFSQRMIGVSVFEWGQVKAFAGTLYARPYPHLVTTGPKETAAYYLVKPFKFGFTPTEVTEFDGKAVELRGTLIHRGDQRMIEVVDGSLKIALTNSVAPPQRVSLGRHTLRGEIVDSKCYFGVMNPGQLKPHRACAVRCISGGIPPVLLVRQREGPALYFALVSPEGKPVNKDVLDFVAEPVEITGEVIRQGELLILQADPRSITRL